MPRRRVNPPRAASRSVWIDSLSDDRLVGKGRAPSGTAPGFVEHAMKSDHNARRENGT